MNFPSYRFTREWKRVAQPLAFLGLAIWGGLIVLMATGLKDLVPYFKELAVLGLIYGGAFFCFVAFWFRKRPERIRIDGVTRCIACRYPAELAVERCPECGADLSKAGAVVLGVPQALGNTGALFLLLVGLGEIGLAISLWFVWFE